MRATEFALTAAGSGGTTATIAHLLNKKKNNADVASVLVEAAKALIEPLRQEVETLHREVNELKERLAHMESGVSVLTRQIEELGHTPVWAPGL